MVDDSGRVQCPKCGASNLGANDVCWQCGQALRVLDQDSTTTSAETASPEGTSSPYEQPQSNQVEALVIIGFVLAAFGILGCCPVFSIASMILGAVASRRGGRLSAWVIVAGGAALALNLVAVLLSALLFSHSGAFSGCPLPGQSWK